MLRRTLTAIAIFAAMPAIGVVSAANAGDRSICFKEQSLLLNEKCVNPQPRRNPAILGGQQNGAGQPGFGVPGGHGFPGANGGNLNGNPGNPGGDNPGGGGGPQPG